MPPVLSLDDVDRENDVFAEPYALDVGRTPNPHIAVGGGGPHFCSGLTWRKLEVQVMFDHLVPWLGSMELTGPVQRVRSNFTNALRQMPVRLTLT